MTNARDANLRPTDQNENAEQEDVPDDFPIRIDERHREREHVAIRGALRHRPRDLRQFARRPVPVFDERELHAEDGRAFELVSEGVRRDPFNLRGQYLRDHIDFRLNGAAGRIS